MLAGSPHRRWVIDATQNESLRVTLARAQAFGRRQQAMP
jgi:hypothetical protein